MIVTHLYRAKIPRQNADALNQESGRIYTQVMVEHWRVYRRTGHWLSQQDAERYNDYLGGETFLHAHSRDAAQQGFYKACEVVRTQRKMGLNIRYPWRRKQYRTTIWKNTGIRRRGDWLRLALAKGYDPIMVRIPKHLRHLSGEYFREMRLVYNKGNRHYEWHLVVDDGREPTPPPGDGVAGVDLGEVHPAVISNGDNALVVSCRELRALNQYRNKRLAELRSLRDRKKKHSRRWWRIQHRINRFLAKNRAQRRDLEHKISRAIVDWCIEYKVGEIAIGDVRDVAEGKRLNRKSQQKVSNWSHGKIRKYIGYKAEAVGIRVVDDVHEAYTSQTCCSCGQRYKPRGRVYTCPNPNCSAVYHRDVGGSSNILSRHLYAELAQIDAPVPIYFRPLQKKVSWPVVSRSRVDTPDVARG